MAEGLPGHSDKPALIVYGDHDIPFTIQMFKKWHERLPEIELIAIKNALHILNQDNPEAFNQVFLDYLNQLD